MLARVRSAVLCGMDAVPVNVEVDLATQGLPQFKTVGLPDAALRESHQRVKVALRNVGLRNLSRHITVNLAPAELPKTGACFDLPIALGVLAAEDKLDPARLEGLLVVGELGLDAGTRPVRGALSYALLARRLGLDLVISCASAGEAALVSEVKAYGVASLTEALLLVRGELDCLPAQAEQPKSPHATPEVDLSEVKGQVFAKRALEVAAGGGHNLLMMGPPGAGKTMLARRLPGLLPPLDQEEAFETTRVWSVAGMLEPGAGLVADRPFRAPHHTTSYAGLVGGYRPLRPGEVSLATNGVLLLDEMPEFNRSSLEALREPMEEGLVRLVRYGVSCCYPARFQLVGAMNPCPCGFLGDDRHDCACAPAQVERYRVRLSGPLLDRIDIHVQVPRIAVEELAAAAPRGESGRVRERVLGARERQRRRFHGLPINVNAHMPDAVVEDCALPDEKGRRLLEAAVERYGLSPRGYVRVLKVARTIADLAGLERVSLETIAESLQFRVPEGDFS